jgi:ketosteroid isomerase-like protein
VSDQNVAIVRSALEALNAGDIDSLVELCDPGFRLDMSERVLNPATYDGHEGIRRFHGEVYEVWAEFMWEPEELHDAGERVVALLHSHGRGRGSGLEIDRNVAMVWTVRDGKAVGLRFYIDQSDALKAAGLDDQVR